MGKTSYLTRYDLIKRLQRRIDEGKITSAQCWRLVIAMMDYDENCVKPDFQDDLALDSYWDWIKEDMDNFRQKYEKKCQEKANAGAKGGAPKGNKNASKQAKAAKTADEKQPKTTKNKQNKQKVVLLEKNNQNNQKQAKQANGCFACKKQPKQAKQADIDLDLDLDTDRLTSSVYQSMKQQDGRTDGLAVADHLFCAVDYFPDEQPEEQEELTDGQEAADWFFYAIKRRIKESLSPNDREDFGERMLLLCDSIRQKKSIPIGSDTEKRYLSPGKVLKAIDSLFSRPEQIFRVFAAIDANERLKNRFAYTVTALYNTAQYG